MPKKKSASHIQNAEAQEYTGTQELLDSEEGLIGYSTAIIDKFFHKMNLKNCILAKEGKLLEFGAGTGFLAENI